MSFWLHETIKNAKKSGIYAFILHNYPILVRSTGIEDIRRYKKSLDFQGFFAVERQRGRQNFLGKVWYYRSYLTAKTNQIWSDLRFLSVLLISLISCHKTRNRHTMYEFKLFLCPFINQIVYCASGTARKPPFFQALRESVSESRCRLLLFR